MSVVLSVPEEVATGLDDLARATGRSRNDLAAEALAAYLEDERAWIAALERGLSEVAAGELVPHEDIAAWARSLGTEHELPLPRAKR